jgi:hypothetical protein
MVGGRPGGSYAGGMRVVVLGAITIFSCARDPQAVEVVTAVGPKIEPVAADRTLIAVRDDAHRVMSARCGECHESHRPTAKPRALAIFDLDHPDWPTRFDDHLFEAGLMRFSSAPEPDRAAFVAFRDAELAARLGSSR